MVAEVLVEYGTLLASYDGRLFRARAFGEKLPDATRRWRGWLEFVPFDGGAAVRTGCETTQPNRPCTIYWATGLRASYLEGALGRAMKAPSGRAVRRDRFSVPGLAASGASAAAGTSKSRWKTATKAAVVEPTSHPIPRQTVPSAGASSNSTSKSRTRTPARRALSQPSPAVFAQTLNAWDRWLLKSLGIALR
jgi:hypothetical protein